MASPWMSSTTPASPLPELPQPVAVACHDAGGANQLAAWWSQGAPAGARAFVTGPAAALWARRFGAGAAAASLEQALHGTRSVVTGTGWGSDLEHRARSLARANGQLSVAVLDHWVNYPQRFTRDGQTVWPDRFWVTDEDALALARRSFPGAPVELQVNAYLAEQLAGIGPAAAAPPQLLYVLEPVRDDWGRGVPGEFQALDFFSRCLPRLGLPPGLLVRLRPHPSDPPGKYDAWLRGAHPFPVALDACAGLGEAISSARWVAGCESYAMVVALQARRRVFGTLPPWAPACRLPQAGIEHLRLLEGEAGA